MMSKAKMAASGYCLTLIRNPNVGVWSESGGPTFEWRQGGCIPKWEDCVDAALAAMKESEVHLWDAYRRLLTIDFQVRTRMRITSKESTNVALPADVER